MHKFETLCRQIYLRSSTWRILKKINCALTRKADDLHFFLYHFYFINHLRFSQCLSHIKNFLHFSVSFLLCLLSAFLSLSFTNFLHFSLHLSDCTVYSTVYLHFLCIFLTSFSIFICVFLTLTYYLRFSFCHS